MLATAARELAFLPEAAEAARTWSGKGSVSRVLPLLDRVSQVVLAVPSPAMRLVAHGALAQVHRASARLDLEAEQWSSALAATADAPPALQLHAANGAALCALCRADAASLKRSCSLASEARDALAKDGEAALAARWGLVFQSHASLGAIVAAGGSADPAHTA